MGAVRRSWKLNWKARIYQRCSATSFAQFICTVHLSRAWRIAPAVSVASYWQSHDVPTWAVRSTINLSIALLEGFGNNFAVTEEPASIVGELYAKADMLIEKCQAGENPGGHKYPRIRQEKPDGWKFSSSAIWEQIFGVA
ncbi:hypothetical protein BDR22DRAFT_894023 [Usnea florida]